MTISEFSVKRPITSIMLMLMFVVLGLMSLLFLKIELFPTFTFPNLMVITEYDGVAPEEVEKSVTKIIETAVRSVPGIKNAKSQSIESYSIISAEFNYGTDLDNASAQIRDRVGQVKNYLPTGSKEPIVFKLDTSGIPVVVMSVRPKKGAAVSPDTQQMYKFGKDVFQPKLEKTPGVATVYTMGGREREIKIDCDRGKLLAYTISLSQIAAKIRMENLNVSAGSVADSAQKEFLVRAIGEFQNPESIGKIIVGSKSGVPVYLKDVAKISDDYEDEMGKARSDGYPGISVIVTKENDANTVDVERNVQKTIKAVKKELPEGMEIKIMFNTASIVTDSIGALARSALYGAFFAALIIFAFLGRVRPTLVITIAIPISLFLAFTSMYFAGSTINIMTLGGLVIALGRLVDDSVVVMENIFRRKQLGEDSVSAAVLGTNEVAIPVVSSTIVTVIVLLPIVFAQGLAVQLFKQFALTVFFAMLGSLVVAFTIVPMIASKLFAKGMDNYDAHKSGAFDKLKKVYGRWLTWTLDNKRKFGLIVLAVVIFTIILGGVFIKTDFLPKFIAGSYQIAIKQQKGATLESTEELVKRVESRFMSEVPGIERLSSNIGTSSQVARMAAGGGNTGPSEAQLMIGLKKDAYNQEKKLYDVAKQIAAENKGADIRIASAGSANFGSGRAIEIKIFGDDLDLLRRLGSDLKLKLAAVNGVSAPASSLDEGLPEFNITYDRDKISRYGLTTGQVNAELNTAVDGQVASVYREAGEESNVRVRLSDKYRKNLKDLLEIPVSSPLGFVFPLKDVAQIKFIEGPAKIERENAKRLVNVSADLDPRAKLSDVAGAARSIMAATVLPDGYFFEFGGQVKDRDDTFLQLGLVMLLSMLLIYMILASLYESFLHPLTILLSVPFAFTGAFLALIITNTSLGVTAFIGLIMLVGIVATNAIVLIDFILIKQETEKDRKKAIVEAAETRLRPILITAIATMVALFPIALGWEEGLDLQIPLGRAVVGGLITSTLLTLFLIPVVYDALEKLKEKLGIKEK